MDELKWGGGKNRQKKKEKKKQKGTIGKYNAKSIRIKLTAKQNTALKADPKQVNIKKKKKKQNGGSNIQQECSNDTVYSPDKCCLPGIKCIAPCYNPDFKNDSYPCVDKAGNSRSQEIMNLIKCKRGDYNPDSCCEKDSVGSQCLMPCLDDKNCYATDGTAPMKKIIKRERARKSINKLKELNKARSESEQEGGLYLYNKIVNPETGRKVNINGIIGKKVLQNYLNQLN